MYNNEFNQKIKDSLFMAWFLFKISWNPSEMMKLWFFFSIFLGNNITIRGGTSRKFFTPFSKYLVRYLQTVMDFRYFRVAVLQISPVEYFHFAFFWTSSTPFLFPWVSYQAFTAKLELLKTQRKFKKNWRILWKLREVKMGCKNFSWIQTWLQTIWSKLSTLKEFC